MKLDTQLGHRGLSAAADEARSYERIGFDGAWTFEAGHDPFLPVALAAQATERLSLGTNIAVAFARSRTVTSNAIPIVIPPTIALDSFFRFILIPHSLACRAGRVRCRSEQNLPLYRTQRTHSALFIAWLLSSPLRK